MPNEINLHPPRWQRSPPLTRTTLTGSSSGQRQTATKAPLKILIVSTPKTGNTWLKYLLANIYQLPLVEVPVFNSAASFDENELATLGDAWIGHQHYAPTDGLQRWARAAHVNLITTVRHPGDVLLSYRHYVRTHAAADMLLGPGWKSLNSTSDEDLLTYVRTSFFLLLHLSISWMASGRSLVIRYEDLWRDPVDTLIALCARIAPAPIERIKPAVEQCHIGMLREMTSLNPQFFRCGEVGGWRDELPEAVVHYLATVEPYRSQLGALGYTMDPGDPLVADPPLPWKPLSPFHTCPTFDNGVAVPALVNHLYLSLPAEVARQRWPDPRLTAGADSFYAWLAGPADQDPRPHQIPQISNFAAYIYQLRTGMQELFPDLFGADRAAFALWFVRYALEEHKLDQTFFAFAGITMWTEAWASGEHPREGVPPLSELAVAVYRDRADVQAIFPDLYGRDRVAYLAWFLTYSIDEHRLDPSWIERTREHFAEWAESIDPADPCAHELVPPITRLAAYVFRRDPDVPQQCADIFGVHRNEFLTWFCQLPLAQPYLRTILARWAVCAKMTEPALRRAHG